MGVSVHLDSVGLNNPDLTLFFLSPGLWYRSLKSSLELSCRIKSFSVTSSSLKQGLVLTNDSEEGRSVCVCVCKKTQWRWRGGGRLKEEVGTPWIKARQSERLLPPSSCVCGHMACKKGWRPWGGLQPTPCDRSCFTDGFWQREEDERRRNPAALEPGCFNSLLVHYIAI